MAHKHTALLVIDMQKAYFNNGVLAGRRHELVAACNQLIDAMTSKGYPVILVRTEHKRDQSTWTLNMLDDKHGYLFESSQDTKYVTGLRATGANELIKTRDSAFRGTDLTSRLHVLGINRLVLAGVSTHSCILFTAADAYAANFRVTLARDAIGSHDPAFHDSTLDMLHQEYRQGVLANSKILGIIL